MLFEVNLFSEDGYVGDRPVNWIKSFREDTGCGLKEAKSVCDYLRNLGTSYQHDRTTVVVNTKQATDLDFLDDIARIRYGNCRMIRMVNTDFRQTAGEVVGKSDKNELVDAVLKNAAIRLIRLNAFNQASAVLKVLM